MGIFFQRGMVCGLLWQKLKQAGTFCTSARELHTLLAEVMRMSQLVYQPLNDMECLDVLRSAHVTRAAFCDGEQPYIVPMAFQLACEGTMPLICLCMPDTGRKVEYLCRCDRVCLEFESPSCAWVDVVLLEGTAQLDAWEKGAGLALHVRGEKISGRRFFLPE